MRDIPVASGGSGIRHLYLLLAGGAITYALLNTVLLASLIGDFASRGAVKTAALGLFFAAGFVGVMFGLSVLPPILQIVLRVAMTVSVTINFTLYLVSQMPVTRPTVSWLQAELGHGFAALQEFGGYILASLAAAVALTALLAVLQGRAHRWLQHHGRPWAAVWVPRCGVALLAAVPASAGLASMAWPAFAAQAESNLYAFGALTALYKSPASAAVTALPIRRPASEKIVLVVDESIRPDVFLQKIGRRHESDMVMFENGWSTANCSASSNALLRWGVRRNDIGKPHDPRSNTTIWTYALAAGFKTVMIDGQSAAKPQNFMRPAELAQIDEFVPMKSGVDTDLQVAQLLLKRLAIPGKEFIYINKRGAHFPYDANLPPVLQRLSATRQDKYEAAVAYSTGRFFDTLLSNEGGLDRATIFYTSDHGQYLGRGGTHCRGQHAQEYEVPIAVLGAQSDFLNAVRTASRCWSGGTSHQNMRTSVIESFGYARADLEGELFPALTTCVDQPVVPRFNGTLPFPASSSEVIPFSMEPARGTVPSTDATS
jgi:glucan phosphoethanolaminetransferase (alkaline phosphatase superfamily)